MPVSPKKIYGLIGYPVKHSLSALMHNAAFQALGIDAEYKLFPLSADQVGPFLRNLAQNNILGLNVTVPYKEKVIAFLDTISPEARMIGAVNTIKAVGGRLRGFNTDGEGFIRHLKRDLKFEARAKNIAIIGAGGAARAVSVYLSKARPKSISIYDLDQSKSSVLIKYLKKNFKGTVYQAASCIAGLGLADCQLLINASPVGMKEADPCLVDKTLIHKDLLVYDLIYNPPQTRLLAAAQEKSARISNGLGMLLYQGARSFEIWTAKKAPVRLMRKALEEGVKKI